MTDPAKVQDLQLAADLQGNLEALAVPGRQIELYVDTGACAVSVSVPPGLRGYLSDFYSLADTPCLREPQETWRIEAYQQVTPPLNVQGRFDVSDHGVRYLLDPLKRSIIFAHPDEDNLAITVRKVIRELYINSCERRHFSLFHSSVVYSDSALIMFVGAKESGKTTLALSAMLRSGFQFLSNDHGVILPGEKSGCFIAKQFPTYTNVKRGTLCAMRDDLASVLPLSGAQQFEFESICNPRHPFYFPPRVMGLNRDREVEFGDSSRKLVLVFPRFLEGCTPKICALNNREAFEGILQESRDEWVYSPVYNPRLIGLPRRTLEEFRGASQSLARSLVANAEVKLSYFHPGDIRPLLECINGGI